MDQLHRHSALANRGGAPLDRATAHVASGEYSRQARLQEERLPRTFSPGVLIKRRTVQLPARQDEATLVEFDGSVEPAGVGFRTDEDKERPGIEGSTRAGAVVLDHDTLQAVLPREFSDLCVREQLDVLGIHDPVDEIPRHALGQVVAPYEQVNPPRASRQEQRRLARRVAPAHDRNLLALAPLSLGLRCGIVDAYPLKLLQSGHVESAVAGPARGYHAASCHFAALGELDAIVTTLPS